MKFDPSTIKTAGDSWSSAHAADTNDQYSGWPSVLGIPSGNRFAVAGSTAEEWARGDRGMLSRLMHCPADVCVLSLGGNDLGRMRSVEEFEAVGENVEAVLRSANARRVIALLYANPFPGNFFAALATRAVNSLVLVAAERAGAETLDLGPVIRPEHFLQRDRNDIHPVMAGWEAVADAIRAKIEEGQ